MFNLKISLIYVVKTKEDIQIQFSTFVQKHAYVGASWQLAVPHQESLMMIQSFSAEIIIIIGIFLFFNSQ